MFLAILTRAFNYLSDVRAPVLLKLTRICSKSHRYFGKFKPEFLDEWFQLCTVCRALNFFFFFFFFQWRCKSLCIEFKPMHSKLAFFDYLLQTPS